MLAVCIAVAILSLPHSHVHHEDSNVSHDGHNQGTIVWKNGSKLNDTNYSQPDPHY